AHCRAADSSAEFAARVAEGPARFVTPAVVVQPIIPVGGESQQQESEQQETQSDEQQQQEEQQDQQQAQPQAEQQVNQDQEQQQQQTQQQQTPVIFDPNNPADRLSIAAAHAQLIDYVAGAIQTWTLEQRTGFLAWIHTQE